MQLIDPKRMGAPSAGLFNPKEKKRLALLTIGVVAVIGSVLFVNIQAERRKASKMQALEQHVAPLPTEIAVPKIDVAALEAAASDALPEQRVVLPAEALEAGFAAASQVYDGVFAALGGRELTREIAAEIVAAPQRLRGQLFRGRCTVDEMRELPNPADAERPRYLVRAHLEDDAPLWFAVQHIQGLAPVPGDFVRFDGLFVRVHRAEIGGQWVEAPLFVGPTMYESFRTIPPVKELAPGTFAFVQDDSVQDGMQGLDHDSYWKLVSYVKHLDAGAVDWASVPELDNKTISAIHADGTAWRGKPVRIPVAVLFQIWKKSMSENPLRQDEMLEGWFTRGDWSGQAKVGWFVAPNLEQPDIERYFTARAFFYKNLAYTPKGGGAAIAPYFVVHSLEKFVPPDHTGLRQMTYIVAGSLVVLGFGVVLMLRRDRKSSAALEAELLRRRRERRQKLSPSAKA